MQLCAHKTQPSGEIDAGGELFAAARKLLAKGSVLHKTDTLPKCVIIYVVYRFQRRTWIVGFRCSDAFGYARLNVQVAGTVGSCAAHVCGLVSYWEDSSQCSCSSCFNEDCGVQEFVLGMPPRMVGFGSKLSVSLYPWIRDVCPKPSLYLKPTLSIMFVDFSYRVELSGLGTVTVWGMVSLHWID